MGYFIKISAFVVNVQKVDKLIMIGQRQKERERDDIGFITYL